jgi:hypothetical protein
MNIATISLMIGRIVFALLLSSMFVCAAWAQTAVEYGILGSKSAPTSKIGKSIQGRLEAVSGQPITSSKKQTPKRQSSQQPTKYYAGERTATDGPNKFTIYSSEGVREITVEQSDQSQEQGK